MRKAEKVATSNGYGYAIKFQKEQKWQAFKDPKPVTYRIPPNYIPHHMKVLKTACKLFLGSKLSGYVQDPQKLHNSVFTAFKTI